MEEERPERSGGGDGGAVRGYNHQQGKAAVKKRTTFTRLLTTCVKWRLASCDVISSTPLSMYMHTSFRCAAETLRLLGWSKQKSRKVLRHSRHSGATRETSIFWVGPITFGTVGGQSHRGAWLAVAPHRFGGAGRLAEACPCSEWSMPPRT